MKNNILLVILMAFFAFDRECSAQTSSGFARRSTGVEIAAGDLDRAVGTPVFFELPEGTKLSQPAMLWPADGKGFHVQIVAGERVSVAWLLERTLKAGETRHYGLREGVISNAYRLELPLSESLDAISITEAVTQGGTVKPILAFRKTPTAEAAGYEPYYTRTGYIHPLLTPSGKNVTGDYPVDHPHQHGLFFAWTDCTFEGRDINFWDQKAQTARIRHLPANDSRRVSGPAFTEFTVNQRHEDLSAPGGAAKTVLNETWQVRTWRPVGDYYLIDIVSTQTCASDSPLAINQYHYGGMAMRGTADWFIDEKGAEQPGDFLTSEGKTRTDGNHSRPNWVDMHGRYPDGSHAGVAVFDHPDNFRFPQWVRLHPSKPYFVFTPQVEEGFEIKPGEPYVSRYRYVVHDGPPDAELLDRLWNDYAHPPKVNVTEAAK